MIYKQLIAQIWSFTFLLFCCIPFHFIVQFMFVLLMLFVYLKKWFW